MRNHKGKQNWDAKCTPNFKNSQVINDRVYDLQDPSGHDRFLTVADTQLLMLAEYIACILPDEKAFEWACEYVNGPSLKLNLN